MPFATPFLGALVAQAAAPPATPCGAPDEASALCEAVYRATGNELLSRGADILLVRPAKILVIVAVAFVATRLVRRGIRRFVQSIHGDRVRSHVSRMRHRAPGMLLATSPTPTLRAVQRAETIGAVLRSIATFAIWGVAIVMILGEFGLNLGPLVAGAGIVGVALGFGAQNLVRDFLTGVFMLIEDQYGVGDVVDAGPATGTVEAVSLRTTRLRDVEGNVWHIPNGTISRIANKSQQWSRALIDVPVSYTADPRQASDLIKDVADRMAAEAPWSERILSEPEVWGVEDFGADAVKIRLVVKTLPLAQWEVARELRARLKVALEERGIDIPVPQREVRVHLAPEGGELVAPLRS